MTNNYHKMEQLNKVELRGNIGSVHIQNVGCSKVARFSMATNLIYRGQDGCAVIETTWHNIVAWEGTTKDLSLLEKGAKVEISGRLRNQRYVGEDGIDRYMTEILANKITILPDESLTMEEE